MSPLRDGKVKRMSELLKVKNLKKGEIIRGIGFELKEGEKLSTNINAICLVAYSDNTSSRGSKVTILE